MPMRVALVPHVISGRAPQRDVLLRVAAALQTQIVRDLAPVWGVSAIVSPFLSLHRVPPGYVPLVVVVGSELPLNRQGFHLMAGGHPAALIEYGDGWSVNASHELIEMVCDPAGTATAPGPSLADELARVDGAKLGQRYRPQGTVDYLMEVCDPCESSTYAIDGVLVSDFLTPAYYRLGNAVDGRYSFTGSCQAPLQLLGEGYLTWRTEDAIWQAFAPGGDGTAVAPLERLRAGRIGEVGETFSRPWVDAHPNALRRDEGAAPKPRAPRADDAAAKKYGAALRTEISLMLKGAKGPIDPQDQDALAFLSRYSFW